MIGIPTLSQPGMFQNFASYSMKFKLIYSMNWAALLMGWLVVLHLNFKHIQLLIQRSKQLPMIKWVMTLELSLIRRLCALSVEVVLLSCRPGEGCKSPTWLPPTLQQWFLSVVPETSPPSQDKPRHWLVPKQVPQRHWLVQGSGQPGKNTSHSNGFNKVLYHEYAK